jgi:hypothetical protein
LNGTLRYAYMDESGWNIHILDANVPPFTASSLALDQAGYPHVSYLGTDAYTLKYIFQDETGWCTETVDNRNYGANNLSMVLDEAGFAHISYTAYFEQLRYATNLPAKYLPAPIFLPMVIRAMPTTRQ